MDSTSRRIRALLYLLTDVEAGLRKAARGGAAGHVGALVKNFSSLSPQEFVEGSREALEIVLLGERDLPADLLGLTLDGLGAADEILLQGFSYRTDRP